MNKYILTAGVLHRDGSKSALLSIKGVLSTQEKKLLSPGGELVARTCVRLQPARGEESGRVDRRTYVLADGSGRECATAVPRYAAGNDPADAGWPVCRMPLVDHATVAIAGTDYELYMNSSQSYTLYDGAHRAILRILHRGMAGGWSIEDEAGFAPPVVCAVFVFCRYIERENEFIVV